MWHELVTWAGRRTVSVFSEGFSAFSPEDLYSDLLGARLAERAGFGFAPEVPLPERLLAVQKASDAKNGQIVVARLGDEVTVKRFRRTKQGIDLIPENTEFKTLHVAAGAEHFQLEGIAVGLVRNTMLM